jgi:hypothetical protein
VNAGAQARNAILVSRRQVGHAKLVHLCFFSVYFGSTLFPSYMFDCSKELYFFIGVVLFCLHSTHKQGNPVLKHIKNIRWVFSDIVPDYILGQNSCALYLRFLFIFHSQMSRKEKKEILHLMPG